MRILLTSGRELKLRARFGRPWRMAGNIAKEAALDRAIECLMPLVAEGGFLPALDDMASPDIPFSHYRYMIERLQTVCLDERT